MLYDPSLEAHVEESRQLNQLVGTMIDAAGMRWDTPEGLAQLREMRLPGQEPLEDTEVFEIPGPEGPIPTRVRHPAREPRGVYLDIHGGGMCIGDASEQDQRNDLLATSTGVVTVSIDYRLAPEHPFPAGPDDCEAAACWLLENAASTFGTDRLLIGGGSAGAYMAALTLLRLRDRHDAALRFSGANLVFGCYDLGMTPSQRAGSDAIGIPTPVLELCYEHFAPGLDAEQRRAPAISPLFADLEGLPPALFVCGTLDPLLDDTLFMAARWEAAGNPVELAIYPESIHGFVAFPTALGEHARDRIRDWVRARLD